MPKFRFDISYTRHGELNIDAANAKDAIEIVQEMTTYELEQIMTGPWVLDVTVFKGFGRNRDEPVVQK